MNKLNELMETLCPDGVTYRKVSDVAKISIGEFVKKDKQNDNSPYPVFNGGISNTGYYDDFNMLGNKIIMSARGANAGFVNRVYTNYWAGNSCYSIDVFDKNVDWNYVFYALKNDEKKFIAGQQTASIPSVSKKQLENHEIAIPPLAIQLRIVELMNQFVELINVLEAELYAREKQFIWMQNSLLNNYKESTTIRLDECCTLEKGKTAIQKSNPGEYPLVVTTKERKSCDTYQFENPSVCVPLVSSRGHGVACLNQVYYQEGKFALGNILCAVTPKDVHFLEPKFLFYYLNFKKDSLIVPLMKGGANVSLTVDSLKKVKINIPSIDEQRKIVEYLQKMEALCESVTEGVPAEIEARKKQYVHYRNVIFSFDKVGG